LALRSLATLLACWLLRRRTHGQQQVPFIGTRALSTPRMMRTTSSVIWHGCSPYPMLVWLGRSRTISGTRGIQPNAYHSYILGCAGSLTSNWWWLSCTLAGPDFRVPRIVLRSSFVVDCGNCRVWSVVTIRLGRCEAVNPAIVGGFGEHSTALLSDPEEVTSFLVLRGATVLMSTRV